MSETQPSQNIKRIHRRFAVTAHPTSIELPYANTVESVLVVQVSDEAGRPVTRLNEIHFKVFKLGEPSVVEEMPVFFFSEISAALPFYDLPGVYYIKLDSGHIAARGSYVFALRVERKLLKSRTPPTIEISRGLVLVPMVKLR